MTIFVHIGNPKCASTSIQAMLSKEAGNDYLYRGFCPSPDKHDWYADDTIAELLNFDLRYCRADRFETKKHTYRDYFSALTAQCNDRQKDLWISSENLSCKFILEDIDTIEKLDRLQSILPDGVTFVILFRNIKQMLTSIYLEYLKQGYTGTFEAFCDESYLFRDANFMVSLFPGHQLELITTCLKGNNTLRWHLLSAGSKNYSTELANFFSSFRPSTCKFDKAPNLNSASNQQDRQHLHATNAEQPSTLCATGLLENHRAFWHLSADEEAFFDEHIWGKLRLRHQVINQYEASLSRSPGSPDLLLSERMKSFLSEVRPIDDVKFRHITGSETGKPYERLWA